MKQIIIIEDDIHLACLMQENINTNKNLDCQHIFTNPVEFLNNPVEADIYLLDIIMPEMDGLTAIEKIHKLYPNAIIGYIDKQSFEINFKEVFESVANGGAYMTPKIARMLISFINKPRQIIEQLTEREKDIVNGIVDGLSYKLIADRHEIAIDTVRMNVKKVYRKLSINSKSELFSILRIIR